MPTLEDKIKELMESKEGEEQLSEESIEDLEVTAEGELYEAKVNVSKDGDVSVDSDEDEEDDEEDDDEKTDMAKDKKNDVEVKEAVTPGQEKDEVQGSEEDASAKNSKLKSGMGQRDATAGSLKDTASADKQDDNGDNARLKAGMNNADRTAGSVKDGVTGEGENENQKKNASGTSVQKGADKSPVSEHMAALFNGEELSEDFQNKAKTIFEAAIEEVAAERIDTLEEEYAQEIVKLQEQQEVLVTEAVEEIKEDLVDKIDGFLNYVVEEWVTDNQVELESGIKVEMVSDFIDGLKTLFKEHYVDIPEDKLDIIEEQADEIDIAKGRAAKLEEQLEEANEELVALKSELVFEAVSEGLTVPQADKLKDLSENVEFTSEDEYAEKLITLKESYFPNGKASKVITEEVTPELNESKGDVMSDYVSAISKNIKF